MMRAAATFDIAHEFAEALAERIGDELVQVALFGSRARGEARWRSDYDLMVVLRSASGKVRDEVHGLGDHARARAQRRASAARFIVTLEVFLHAQGFPLDD